MENTLDMYQRVEVLESTNIQPGGGWMDFRRTASAWIGSDNTLVIKRIGHDDQLVVKLPENIALTSDTQLVVTAGRMDIDFYSSSNNDNSMTRALRNKFETGTSIDHTCFDMYTKTPGPDRLELHSSVIPSIYAFLQIPAEAEALGPGA